MRVLLSGLLLLLAACSSTSVTGTLKGKESQDLALLAVLPIRAESDISRERLQLVQRLVRIELEGKGYLLVDEQIVHRVCGQDPECKNRGQLISKYGAQGFAEQTLDSVARANFIAGYVNSIEGTLTLKDRAGEELLKVENTRRERGGLLFNTGQLGQAVIQTVSNAKSDESFAVLAGLYAKDLVDQVPRSAHKAEAMGQVPGALNAELGQVELQAQGEGAERVCARGTPGSLAFLVYHRVRTGLRETSSGTYCGIFRLSDFAEPSALALELRTPYGDVARQPLNLKTQEGCDLNTAVKLSKADSKNELNLICDPGARVTKILVYRAAGDTGAFQKVGEIKGKRWAESAPAGSRYAVVAVLKNGDLTPPIVVNGGQSS